MNKTALIKLIDKHALDGYEWRVRDSRFIAFNCGVLTIFGVVSKRWFGSVQYEVGDVYEYAAWGAGRCIARMGNLPDAFQFITNRILFVGPTTDGSVS
jgi:hypothetical protein